MSEIKPVQANSFELPQATELPPWFSYPRSFLRMVENGVIRFEPWWILDRDAALQELDGLKGRYPNRDLVPFARSQQCDDVACWELGDLSRVVVIHDYASSGWEQRAVFETFWDWLRSAIEDFVEFEP
jgi:hypothetical protein